MSPPHWEVLRVKPGYPTPLARNQKDLRAFCGFWLFRRRGFFRETIGLTVPYRHLVIRSGQGRLP